MCLRNNTSHEIFSDNFARNQGKNFVQPHLKKWLFLFFDSLNPAAYAAGFCFNYGEWEILSSRPMRNWAHRPVNRPLTAPAITR